ncbi:MAG TPA: hypothetical protein VN361_00970, partial [Oxalicibacterium sp.]|nr:hypothetical protein [Oxalicibacterium sp.]
LSTIVDADEIVVLERGHVVERGSHADLLKQRGFYSRLWLLQQRMDRDNAARAAEVPEPAVELH